MLGELIGGFVSPIGEVIQVCPANRLGDGDATKAGEIDGPDGSAILPYHTDGGRSATKLQRD
jgi:hypothetical protein